MQCPWMGDAAIPLTTTLEGFVEVPLDKKWDIGMLGSIGRADLAVDKMFLGATKTRPSHCMLIISLILIEFPFI